MAVFFDGRSSGVVREIASVLAVADDSGWLVDLFIPFRDVLCVSFLLLGYFIANKFKCNWFCSNCF